MDVRKKRKRKNKLLPDVQKKVGGRGMSKKRTVEVVLTVEIPDSKDTTNETVATFFNWEICHRVSEETEGDMVVQKIDVREKAE